MNFNLNKIILLTGGFDHHEAYKFLVKNKIQVIIFDDDYNCFLKQKNKNIIIEPIKRNINKIISLNTFCWSPCSDFGARLADKINRKNKFPTRSLKISVFDKLFQKKTFFKNKILTPKIITHENKNIISKHRKGSGSKNIYKKLIKNKNFYSEEFIKGYEISVETLSQNKNHEILMTSYRDLDNYKSACSIISTPNLMNNKRLLVLVNDILNCLNIVRGICHLEFIINNNNFYIIDANIRCGGFGIASHYLKKIIGQNIFKLDLYSLLNINISLNKYHQFGCLIYTRKNSKKIKPFTSNKNLFFKVIKLNSLNSLKDDLSDSNRNEIIFFDDRSLEALLKKISLFYNKENYLNLLKKMNYLSSVNFSKF